MKRKAQDVPEIESPSGLDLNPRPPRTYRLSKRAGILGLFLAFVVIASVGFGIVSRSQRSFDSVFHGDESKGLTAATDAGRVIAAQIPTRAVLGDEGADRSSEPAGQLQPPRRKSQQRARVPTGQTVLPSTTPSPTSAPQYREQTPEERRLALAYERELQALESSTSIQGTAGLSLGRLANANVTGPNGGVSELQTLLRSLQDTRGTSADRRALSKEILPGIALRGQTGSDAEEYEAQNMQAAKERFVAAARARPEDNYLSSTRTKPASRYEIKAGWDIPAVLEQALNSDLPGEIRALVRESVYDTATGKYLLIPQGARLVGTYDSRVAYGQDGIQVVWSRLIFPDGSSVSLDGMIGQDAGGFSGLRHDVDSHYRRLLGFGLLTSLFSASFQLSQTRRGNVFDYPSPAETAGSAVGAQISQLGADVTRRNLNVQPTIKVTVGYRFNVRVNRDILFEAPYREAAG